MSSATSLTVVSQCNVFPDKKSTLEDLKLSVCDLPMLSCHYIQKGGLFARHPALPVDSLISHLKQSLSQTLSHFPPLAGRFSTDSNGYIYITCNDAGVDFIHATANNISTQDILCPLQVPDCVRGFFAFESTVSYQGHYKPILAVQVTELADGVFIGCSVNHSVADGTSFWNFFNTFSEVSRGIEKISRQPDFSRNSILISEAVLKVPQGGPQVTFNENEPIRERIFSFSRALNLSFIYVKTPELHCQCRETKQSRMAANLRPNLAFQKDSIIMQHGVFALLVETLNSLIQVKYQSINASPFDSHDVIMSVLLAALFTYATASVAEVMLQARESPYCTLAGNLRLFAGALAAISLLSILDPILGFSTAAVWACLFMAVVYESRTELGNTLGLVTHKLIGMFTRLAASVRTRKEQPNQPRV